MHYQISDAHKKLIVGCLMNEQKHHTRKSRRFVDRLLVKFQAERDEPSSGGLYLSRREILAVSTAVFNMILEYERIPSPTDELKAEIKDLEDVLRRLK